MPFPNFRKRRATTQVPSRNANNHPAGPGGAALQPPIDASGANTKNVNNLAIIKSFNKIKTIHYYAQDVQDNLARGHPEIAVRAVVNVLKSLGSTPISLAASAIPVPVVGSATGVVANKATDKLFTKEMADNTVGREHKISRLNVAKPATLAGSTAISQVGGFAGDPPSVSASHMKDSGTVVDQQFKAADQLVYNRPKYYEQLMEGMERLRDLLDQEYQKITGEDVTDERYSITNTTTKPDSLIDEQNPARVNPASAVNLLFRKGQVPSYSLASLRRYTKNPKINRSYFDRAYEKAKDKLDQVHNEAVMGVYPARFLKIGINDDVRKSGS